MYTENKVISSLSISELLNNSKYLIPIYQRNFAWGKKEIEQLLQDIIDKSEIPNSKYYIGTIIVDEKENGTFEIIDGQQRHTTLTLINAYFKKDKAKSPNLCFEARPNVEKYLDSLLNQNTKTVDLSDASVGRINEGYEIIKSFFESEYVLIGNKENDQKKIEDYFDKNVIIIRVNVPKDTDITHYFEIMNTRGIQLEKHQILKAAFIEKIKDDKKISALFGKIWDACSNMEKYIQYGFDAELRKEIFGSTLNKIPKCIREIKTPETQSENNENNDAPKTLQNILSGVIKRNLPESTKGASDGNITLETGKYSSIIDFPNFLLQVLRLKDEKVSLDDKNLLDSFGYRGKSLPDSIEFINDLLKYRTLFDLYFIKRQVDNANDYKWVILKPSEGENDGLVNTFGVDDEGTKLIMIQSMFQVSFPSNSYKNWLNDLLKIVPNMESNFNRNEFFNIAFGIAKGFYRMRVADENWQYKGVGINNYIFNYTDFLLWKEYDEKVKGKTVEQGDDLLNQLSKCKDSFEKFRFTQRISVEHLHPQHDIDGIEILEDETDDNFKQKDKIINYFGNLCLISSSTNSKYSDYNFSAKNEQFEKRKMIESLKQAIMFSNDKWNTEQIKNHGKKMILLLTQNTN